MAAHEDHLHTESKMLKVEEHAPMLSAQYMAKCLHPEHPCHLTRPVDRIRFPRNIYAIFARRFRDPVVARRVWDPGGAPDCRRMIKDIHTRAGNLALANRAVNRLLNAPPPPVSSREKRLPRKVRCALSQLRSGFCVRTNHYLHNIGAGVQDICPDCQGSPHDVHHLFSCGARRTALTVHSLWTHPIPSSRFLNIPVA